MGVSVTACRRLNQVRNVALATTVLTMLGTSGAVAQNSTQLPTVNVEAQRTGQADSANAGAAPTQQAPSATTQGTNSYTTSLTTIGKGAQPIRYIPQSVSVVTRQRIEDQNLTTLEDAA